LSSRVSSFAVVGVGVDTIYWDSRKDFVNFESADVKVRVDFIFGSFDFSIRIDSVGVDNLSPRFGGVKSHKNLLFGKVVLYWDRAVDISKVVYKVFIADSLISEVVTDSVFVSGLRTSTVYNFNVKVYDLVGNESSSPYSLKVNALCDYNGDNRVDAFDLGSYVKAWSELDYSGSDIYPYDGSLPQVVVRGDGKLDVYDVFTFTKIWDYSHIQGLPKVLSFSFEGVDVRKFSRKFKVDAINGPTLKFYKLKNIVNLGGEFYVSVWVEEVINFKSVQFEVKFDKDKLSLLSVQKGNYVVSRGLDQIVVPDFSLQKVLDEVNNSGKIGISTGVLATSGAGPVSLNGSGEIIKLKFRAKGGGDSYLKFENITMLNSNGDVILINPPDMAYVKVM